MRVVTVQPGEFIPLGYQYDNEATRIIFPSEIISPIPATYGVGGSFAIWYRRPGDALGYPIGNTLVQYANDTVTWDITEAELANPGSAQIQLRYIVDEVCVMSQIWPGYVADSIDIGSEIPEPMEAWADAIQEAVAGAAYLYGLQDVTISNPSDGQVLKYDSNTGKWINASGSASYSLNDLTNVDVSNPSNGQVLKYNSTSQKWENANESGGGGGGADELNDLSDVSLSSVTDNQFLRYDSSSSKWVNESVTIPSAVSPYTSNPAALGASASPGSSSDYSRGDHVHAKPSPSDIGAIAAPSSPATGAFLVYNGSAWVAQNLSTWQGGNY